MSAGLPRQRICRPFAPAPSVRYAISVQIPKANDTTLLLIGHGSTVNADSTASVLLHSQSLRLRGIFAEVQTAFWKVEPFVPGALGRAGRRRVVVAPFFVSDGWFTEEAIPEALGLKLAGQADFARRQMIEGREIFYCQPLGTHARMTEVILTRAREAVRRSPFPRAPRPADLALFLVGHGTERNGGSRQAVEAQAARIRKLGLYRGVHAVFMMEEPRVEHLRNLTDARAVVVVPFFMSDGQHVTEDIPVLLGEPERLVKERLAQRLPTWRNPTEKHGKLIWYSASVGTEPVLTDVILERVSEALKLAR
jgi:sirohydrochlorin cobaltochelatase